MRISLRHHTVLVSFGIVAIFFLYRWRSSAQPGVREKSSTAISRTKDSSSEVIRAKPPNVSIEGNGIRPPRYLAVIAERHSGSTWMVEFLKRYFGGKGVEVTSTLCTWKHWFQDRIHEGIQNGQRKCQESQKCPACHDTNHTLVVALWRNPYDWVKAMSEYPHHSQAHMGLSHDILGFLTKRWMVKPKEELLAREAAARMNATEVRCMDNFLPTEVIPCDPENRNKIYELDPNGEAYRNVYELRKGKIVDFNAVREWVPMYELIRYEDMLKANGLREWLLSLETKYGLVGNDDTIPSEPEEAAMQEKLLGMYYTNSKSCAPECKLSSPANKEALDTLNKFWDDELEASIGYKRVL